MKISKDFKQKIKYLWIRLSYFIFPFNCGSVFVSILNYNNITGPGRFLFNLERGLLIKKIKIERKLLGKCNKALIISSAPNKFYKFCKNKNIKTFLRIDGFSVPDYYNNKSLRKFDYDRIITNQNMQLGLLKSDFIIYQSNFSKEMSDKYLYNRNNNYSIIYNGVNTIDFKPDIFSHSDKLKLGVLGSLRDTDIMLLSLESFKKIKLVNKSVELWFIGSTTDKVLDFINVWKKNNIAISNDIKIFGKIEYDELPNILNKIDISLHLTSGDWCPNSVLENLSCGNPIICFNYGGTKELVGDAGVIIKAEPYDYNINNILKIVDAINLINKNLKKYSKLARERAITKFSLDIMIKEYKNVFNKI